MKRKKSLIISEDFLVLNILQKKKNRFNDDNLVISHAARVTKKNNQAKMYHWKMERGGCVCV